MRAMLLAVLCLSAGSAFQTPAEPPRDWIDPRTGHRVIRLTDEGGGSTLYFHDNAFSPEGDVLMFNTPAGIGLVKVADIGTASAKPAILAGTRGGYFARRSREIFYNSPAPGAGRGSFRLMAVNVDTRETRQLTHARGFINADET